MGWGENMGLAQGKPALAGASPTEKACPILLNQYCRYDLKHSSFIRLLVILCEFYFKRRVYQP